MGRKGEGKEGGEIEGEKEEEKEGERKGGEREPPGRVLFLSCFNFFYDALNIKIVNMPPSLSPLDSRCILVQALFAKAWCLQEDDQRWTNIPSFASHGLCHQVPW